MARKDERRVKADVSVLYQIISTPLTDMRYNPLTLGLLLTHADRGCWDLGGNDPFPLLDIAVGLSDPSTDTSAKADRLGLQQTIIDDLAHVLAFIIDKLRAQNNAIIIAWKLQIDMRTVSL